MKETKKRCFGNDAGKEFYAEYHDQEWGVPTHDDRLLFEILILEGSQAGLNWEIILKKREGYRSVFYNFDPESVARMTDKELEQAAFNPSIIRSRLKIFSARQNARVFIKSRRKTSSLRWRI